MRILLLSQFYPPVSGGVELHVKTLAEGLLARGHDVAVGTLEGGDQTDSDVPVHLLKSTSGRMGMLFTTDRRHAPPVPDPETTLDIRRLVRAFAPDIVHAHNWLGRSFVPVAHGSRARFVVTLHDCGGACAQARRMYRGAEYCEQEGVSRCLGCAAAFFGPLKGAVTLAGNKVLRSLEAHSVDLYLAVSTATAEANRLHETGVPFEIVPNFAAEERVAHDGTRVLGMLPSHPFILQVGDVVPDKGVHVLFEAYRHLSAPPPLVLIGRISQSMRDSLPEGAIATGVWPHTLVSEAWRHSLFGTIPSLCLDACPTVTMEAMAASRPVIASARGGLTDQVADGVTGLLVPPGDPAALYEAMVRLVRDLGLRTRLGKAARRRYESTYRADVVIDRIEGLYESLLAPA